VFAPIVKPLTESIPRNVLMPLSAQERDLV